MDSSKLDTDKKYTDFVKNAEEMITNEGNGISVTTRETAAIEGEKNELCSDETELNLDRFKPDNIVPSETTETFIPGPGLITSAVDIKHTDFIRQDERHCSGESFSYNVNGIGDDNEESMNTIFSISNEMCAVSSEGEDNKPNSNVVFSGSSEEQVLVDEKSALSKQVFENNDTKATRRDAPDRICHDAVYIDTPEINEKEDDSCHAHEYDTQEDMKVFELKEAPLQMIDGTENQIESLDKFSTIKDENIKKLSTDPLDNLQINKTKHNSIDNVEFETQSKEQINIKNKLEVVHNSGEKGKHEKINHLSSQHSKAGCMTVEKNDINGEVLVAIKIDDNSNETCHNKEESLIISDIKPSSSDAYIDDTQNYVTVIDLNENPQDMMETSGQKTVCSNTVSPLEVEKSEDFTNFPDNLPSQKITNHSDETVENYTESKRNYCSMKECKFCADNEYDSNECIHSVEERGKNQRMSCITSEHSCQMSDEKLEIKADGNIVISSTIPDSIEKASTRSKLISQDVCDYTFEYNGINFADNGVAEINCTDKAKIGTSGIEEIEAVSSHDRTDNATNEVLLIEDPEKMISKEDNTSPALADWIEQGLKEDYFDVSNINKTIHDSAELNFSTQERNRQLSTHKERAELDADTNETSGIGEQCKIPGSNTNTLQRKNSVETTNCVSTNDVSYQKSDSKNLSGNNCFEKAYKKTSEENLQETVPSNDLKFNCHEIKNENKADFESGNISAEFDASSKAGHKKIIKSFFKAFPFGNKERGKEFSALLPGNSKSEAVLSKYTKVETDSDKSNEEKHRKGRSVRSLKNKTDLPSSPNGRKQENTITFGKSCEMCVTRPFQNMDVDEIRCLKCFQFECLLCKRQCMCPHTCYCKTLEKNIEDKLADAKKILREKIHNRLPNENAIYTISTHCYDLHDGKTTVTLDFKLSKHFEEQKSDEFQGNFIDILILDYEDSCSRKYLRGRQAVCVILKTVVDEKVIGIYRKGISTRVEKFINPLSKYLDRREIHVRNVDVFSGKLDEKDVQLIVVCQIHSRAISDVCMALSEIEERFYKQVILVLLHFKKTDKRKCASELKSNERFSGMATIDLFQQDEDNNTEDVHMKIIEAINSYK